MTLRPMFWVNVAGLMVVRQLIADAAGRPLGGGWDAALAALVMAAALAVVARLFPRLCRFLLIMLGIASPSGAWPMPAPTLAARWRQWLARQMRRGG